MKNLSVLLFCFISIVSFSQITLKKLDGTTINNGDVITFNVATAPGADFGFIIGNSSTLSIFIKAKCTSMSNTLGNNIVFCINPNCVNSLILNNAYPSIDVSIPAGGTNGNFDHFENLDTGINPNLNVEYVFKFYQVDHSGNAIGTPISFTYRYIPALTDINFDSINNIGVILKSNLVDSNLELNVSNITAMKLYDLRGELIRNEDLVSGDHLIDVSNLKSNIYILNFKNDEGAEASIKIVKK